MNAALFAVPQTSAETTRDRAAAELLAMLTPKYLQRLTEGGLMALRERIEQVLGDRADQLGLFPIERMGERASERASVPPVEINTELATALSPTQVRTFTDCQVKWYYKHVLKLPEIRSAALALGSAFHAAIGENLKQKCETKQDLETPGVVALFKDAWTKEIDSGTVRLAEDENGTEIFHMGAVMVEKYMTDIAPLIEPAAVECEVEGVIGGVKVAGKVDCIDVEGTIIDSKTASKKPSGIMPDYRFQVATYSQLHPKANGRARVDTLTKTKTINAVMQTVQIGEADKLHTARMYPLVQEAMQSGLYVINRASNLCSHKYCAFAARCEREYGGCVDER